MKMDFVKVPGKYAGSIRVMEPYEGFLLTIAVDDDEQFRILQMDINFSTQKYPLYAQHLKHESIPRYRRVGRFRLVQLHRLRREL